MDESQHRHHGRGNRPDGAKRSGTTSRAAVWHLLNSNHLSEIDYSLIDSAAASRARIYIPAVTLIEVMYLVQQGRIAADAFEVFATELREDNPMFAVTPLDSHVANVIRSIPRNILSDMPRSQYRGNSPASRIPTHRTRSPTPSGRDSNLAVTTAPRNRRSPS